MDSEHISEWRMVRFELFQALDSLDVHEIYLIERDNNILTVCFVLEHIEIIKPLTRMRMLDALIARKAPDVYAKYVFLYEVWEKSEWGRQLVSKTLARRNCLA